MANERQELNRQLAQMLKGGVIMDVTTPEQARIAEQAGACAVMALERIPADIRAAGGVSRMSDPKMIRGIQEAVSIPGQLGSFHTLGHVKGLEGDVPMTFIRAPYVDKVLSPDVEILSEAGGHIVAVRQHNQIATAFHPELTDDLRVHQMLINMIP